jgi:hypothetical protein
LHCIASSFNLIIATNPTKRATTKKPRNQNPIFKNPKSEIYTKKIKKIKKKTQRKKAKEHTFIQEKHAKREFTFKSIDLSPFIF